MTIADKILAFRDPNSKEITFCGEQVIVVAPTNGAMPELFAAIRGLAGSEDELKKLSVMDLALPLMPCVPDVAIYCVRDPSDPLQPVFEDTDEVRAKLRRLPGIETTKLLATCLELLSVKG